MSTKKNMVADDCGPADGNAFPKEAFEYEADVTTETVAEVQKRAKEQLDKQEWEVVDEFIPSALVKPTAVRS